MNERLYDLDIRDSSVAGVAVAAAAYASKYGIEAWQAFKARPPRPKFWKFYEGGFQAAMTRREAALILGGFVFLCVFALTKNWLTVRFSSFLIEWERFFSFSEGK